MSKLKQFLSAALVIAIVLLPGLYRIFWGYESGNPTISQLAIFYGIVGFFFLSLFFMKNGS